jgi:type IV secretion system protein VirB11
MTLNPDKKAGRAQIYAQMGPLRDLLAAPGVFECCINRPGVTWVETAGGWTDHATPELTFERLRGLALALASWNADSISSEKPILSAVAPDGERVQFVLPPAVDAGLISMTIRKPSIATFSLAELGAHGLFNAVVRGRDMGSHDPALAVLYDSGDIEAFLALAVQTRKNILISGATGSGKTTLSKALIAHIPLDERIITIEDTPELVIPHPNSVALKYSKDGGHRKVGPQQLLESCLRMRPDRILLQELRDGTAFYYIRNVNSGHPGSITTVHADSCALAFEQLTLLVKQSEAGSGLERSDIRRLLEVSIDVVVQCKRVAGAFRVTELWYGPVSRTTAGNQTGKQPGNQAAA